MLRRRIRMIALDLDGTLLDSQKRLSKVNFNALQRQAEKGVEIVPTTGRFYDAMPEVIRSLPFVHYAITINGAEVFDVDNGKTIAASEIPSEKAIEIMSYLDKLPVVYDCYMDSKAWMTANMKNTIEDYLSDEHFLKMVKDLRRPVDELKKFVAEYGKDVQKMITFTQDNELRQRLLHELPQVFSDIIVSSSMDENIEINDIKANKGNAIHQLSDFLNIDIGEVMSFGDGLNDLNMIKEAGVGVAMSNANEEVLKSADYITLSNDEDGVARAIDEIVA